MRFNVMGVVINRATRQQVADPRVEVIDTVTNSVFHGCLTHLAVEEKYEAFWNEMNPRTENIVKVISVEPSSPEWEPLVDAEARTYELDSDDLAARVWDELYARAARRVADEVEHAKKID